MSFYHLTKLKLLRIEGNGLARPSSEVIRRGAVAVVEWCRQKYLSDERGRMRQIVLSTQKLLAELTRRNLPEPALWQPDTELDGDKWFATPQVDYIFQDLLPAIRRIWREEGLAGTVKKGSLREFSFDKKEVPPYQYHDNNDMVMLF